MTVRPDSTPEQQAADSARAGGGGAVTAPRAAHPETPAQTEGAETLARTRERLAQLEAALSVGQSKLSAAQAQLEKREEMLTWIQTSRSWRFAGKLRRLAAQAQGQRRRFERGLRRLHLLPSPPAPILGFIDCPAEGARATGELEIVGWAFSTAGPVTRVEAFLDDFYLGRLSYGVERPDVSAAHPGRAPEACGYRERAPVLAYMAGPRSLSVRVYDAAGNEQVFTRAVAVEPHDAHTPACAHPLAAPADVVESPAQNAAPAGLTAAADGPRVPGELSGLSARLEEVVAAFVCREEREPSILSWDAGLDLSSMFPHLAVFSPPSSGADELPYLDATVDLVVLSSDDPARMAEARRVASAGVVRLRASAPGEAALDAEWRGAPGKSLLPSASVIIPVHNQISFTENCLGRLRETLPPNFDGEIIVVDDASTDETPLLLERLARADARLRVLRNEQNLGFVGSCNRGAEAAGGEVLVFLNNDTLPAPGWLPPLLRVLAERADAGAVGGKLVYPDGTLQEAGGCIFSDGTGCNFGKHDPRPDAPLYNFLREVDYCSGALLATPRALFLSAGGFDERFAPAYYEDTDYCFALRERGLRVYYQPESVVVHFEGATAGTDAGSGAKRFQEVNRDKFLDKWRHALARQPPPPDAYDFATLHALSVRGGAAGGGDEDA